MAVRRNIPRIVGVVVWLALIAGCSEEPARSKPADRPTKPKVTKAARKTPSKETAQGKSPKTDPKANADAAKPPFEAPFANREDLFDVPGGQRALRTRQRAEQGNVELKGFINVDEPRAMLVIDGRVTTLAVGQQRGTIKVLVIDPPAVTLQRGRVRWTETLQPDL